MLQIEGLKKRYGDREVLRGVDLTVRPGQIVGLLGANGAGKTTMVSIAAGLR
ncbi:ATP-binding cassette domain-containing protein, partial [Kibdelosporangium lantanae]